MIYPEPRYLPGGDRYMLVEFGNEMNLELNFMAQGLAAAILEARIAGVIETAPCFASMLVHYEPEIIGFDDLRAELSRLGSELATSWGRFGIPLAVVLIFLVLLLWAPIAALETPLGIVLFGVVIAGGALAVARSSVLAKGRSGGSGHWNAR